jgi:hypothetical protein
MHHPFASISKRLEPNAWARFINGLEILIVIKIPIALQEAKPAWIDVVTETHPQCRRIDQTP